MTRRLGLAALLSLGIHLAAGLAMAFILSRGLAANHDLADRLRFLDEHRWLWRGGWALWNLAALSILYFYWAFAAAHRDASGVQEALLRLVLPLTLAAVAADLTAEMLEMWLIPCLSAADLSAWDRRAVLLTGFLANGLYTAVAGLLAWACRARYPSWVTAAAGAVVAAGAALSLGAWVGSVAVMVWSNAVLVPAIVAWQAGVGWAAFRD